MTGNATTQKMRSHTSCRAFLDKPVPAALIDEILDCAQMSSSSCFLQVTSIIRLTDQTKKEAIAQGCKQPWVALAPEFWVFCADFHRDGLLCEKPALGWTDHFLVGCLDTGIMVQSAMTALESLGLGGCFVGGIRDCGELVTELLALPDNTAALLGLAFGYPKVINEIKPRLPREAVFMENEYRDPAPGVIDRYDETMREYYSTRTHSKKACGWSEQLEEIINREKRAYLLEHLKRRGWLEK